MPYSIIFSFLFFLVCLGIFIWILTHERRSLRAGVSLVITLFSFAFFDAVVLVNVADLDPHYKDWVLPLFVIVFALIAVGTVIFIITLIVIFLYDGIMGKKVTPLLAARISRGIEIYQENPGSKLIMSGGRGPGEDIPEAEAMAAYAEKLGIPKADIIIENKSRTTKENLQFLHKLMAPNSKFCLVTSSYHVYRALVLAKHQGLKCIGYGAKTKLYFTLNAFVREFIAYLVITKRMQMTVIGFFALMTIIAAAFHF
ncbi:YdcF family protein [Lactobacillus kefiranofaciens subsp. kefirgranum]|uniref:YdcF family protein n=1 Tax=Lactobacillus kefiranofaciens TaxID=267818 RepID=UPI00202F2073|nr:YdcF family protein [Lactobacillus kefiranofaciens]URW70950.1 YdcF family protein [Lactobacillus kefiranofaciens subsp. kefirgranum]URW72894.1 YdcF family protein [Lactobacillus kefiranofaciens subsp. kefirgranum]